METIVDSTREALNIISNHIIRTPLIRSAELSNRLNCELYFKCEHLQTTGSIKARGAFLKILTGKNSGINKFVTASSGNHGLALAAAISLTNAKFKLFVPTTTPKSKIEKIESLGICATIQGQSWGESNQLALAFSRANSYHYVHPFDDDAIVTGHATAALECLEDNSYFDVALCSIGGGGIARGFLGYLKSRLPTISCYGVETYGAQSMFFSFQNNKVMSLPEITSKASGICIGTPSSSTFAFAKQNLNGLSIVSDHAAAIAQNEILKYDKQLVELAASCCVAALQEKIIPDIQHKKVLILLCGGNVKNSELGLENIVLPRSATFLQNNI